MALQAIVSYPGISHMMRAHFVLRPGTTPSTAVLDFAPQPGATFRGGDLAFQFGSTYLVFADCQVAGLTFHVSEEGPVWRLHLHDRRWRWQFGQVSGRYNVRRDDGLLVESTERTPQQLAQQCFEAMGESDADVSELPDELRPTLEWDYDSPARALAQLLAHTSCRAVMTCQGAVRVQRLDTGDPLPLSESLMQYSLATVADATPGQLCVVTGRLRIQCDLQLEAVGIDSDGEVRPLDDLSYRPYGGWSSVDPEHFHAITDLRARELARSSVFRWYRVVTPFELPGHGAVDDLRSVVPFDIEQVEEISVAGPARNRPAIVFGRWCDYPSQAANRSDMLHPLANDPDTIVPLRFDLDRERGLIKFVRPVLRYVEGPYPAPAELVLRTALGVRDPQSGAWKRIERKRQLRSDDLSTEYLLHDELTPSIVPQYDPASYALTGIDTNFDEVFSQADLLLDLAALRYNTQTSQRALLAGLHSVDLLAGIDAVVWTVGPSGATTELIYREHRAMPSGALPASARSRLDTHQARRDLRRQAVV